MAPVWYQVHRPDKFRDEKTSGAADQPAPEVCPLFLDLWVKVLNCLPSPAELSILRMLIRYYD